MSSASAHPRRRPAKATNSSVTPSLIESFQNMSLRKGTTFHSPPSDKHDIFDPLASKVQSPFMPTRSTTCPRSLEDLLIGAGERRAADLLARVDKAIATQSALALGNVLNEPEVLPVPSFILDQTSLSEEQAVRRARTRYGRNHSHSSDSGLGSSVADSNESKIEKVNHTTTDANLAGSNQSFSSISEIADEERGLSKYASDQIHQHIVKPILREPSLKEFHSLIRDVPRRIGDKDICSLRDLEKTLIFLAPDFSRSPSAYLNFCERTIRVLHTTVTNLHETDQRAPTDRPYTQGYFVDLVEQIRRYAAILAATRAKQEKGEDLDEMDYQEGETCTLQGGMTHNGRPAELVRHKDGKTISVASGHVLSREDVAAASSMKRPMSDSFIDDDDVLRSMARRKKGAKPEIHECSICDKEFKRPCDLTKHVKTHERPWKCPQEKCKYHENGWPTEKERDRHVNDKHSTAPSLYKCLYSPCPYTSKRESNCKQHMEKAHGWEYVRSKSNGKNKAAGIRLSRSSVPESPSSVSLTPMLTPIAPSPSGQSWSSGSRRGSMAPPSLPTAGPSNYGTPAFTHPSPDFSGHFNMNFDFNNMGDGFPSSSVFPITPAMSEDRRYSHGSTSHSSLQLDGSSFDDAISPDNITFTNFEYDTEMFNNMQMQQPTPGTAPGSSSSHAVNYPHDSSGNANLNGAVGALHTSPNAQLDVTLTDGMDFDGVYGSNSYGGPDEDFTLFNGASAPPTTAGNMFPDLDNGFSAFGGQFDDHTVHLPTGNSTLDDLFPELLRKQ